MRPSLALLWLGLLEAARYQLSPSNLHQAFNNGANWRKSITISLSSYSAESFPISEWSLSVWVSTIINHEIIFQTSVPYLTLNWWESNVLLYVSGGANDEKPFPGVSSGKWLFIQVGSTAGMSYGLVTIRAGDQYYLSMCVDSSLLSSAVLELFGIYGYIAGNYMDLVLNLNRGATNENLARVEVLSTFMCSADGGNACATCHSSCQTCTDGVCTVCALPGGIKMSHGIFCLCGVSPAWIECPICHASCATCTMNSPNKCTSCKISGATLSNPTGGTCSCEQGYVYKSPATSACQPCYSGCTYCVGTTQGACMGSKELAIFATYLASSFSLPLLDQTNGLICYRQPVPGQSCNPLPEAMASSIISDASGLHPTLDQCYRFLRVQWPYITLWFGELFPTFTPPASATETEVYSLKTMLWLWILQFGPAVLSSEPAWQVLVGVFNSNNPLSWGQMLAWNGAYLAGGSAHAFPKGFTFSPTERELFNHFSQVCASSTCTHKSQCKQVSASSACAVRTC
jgi:hypothetical protein